MGAAVLTLPVAPHRRMVRQPDDLARIRGMVAELREMAVEVAPDRDGLLSIALRLDRIAASLETAHG